MIRVGRLLRLMGVGLVILWGVQSAFAAQTRALRAEAPLDRPYPKIQKLLPEEADALFTFDSSSVAVPLQSRLPEVLALQTPVRSQGSRGTCSIFSATAWLEAWLRRNHRSRASLDLSEEWLEYLVARETGTDGSDAVTNFRLLKDWGTGREAVLPYISEDWESADTGLARERCGHVKLSRSQKACLVGHWDPAALALEASELKTRFPRLAAARLDASRRRAQYDWDAAGARVVLRTLTEVKRTLAAGVPVVLELDFFYGAWNHREAEELGIGRDLAAWTRGEVGYPELGSLDRKLSKKDPAGHSILVVGYDDEEEMRTLVKMADGRDAEFSYRGVYYFKNSWGADRFGKDFEAQGVRAPGYGRISQKYAHEFGGFYRMDLPEKAQ